MTGINSAIESLVEIRGKVFEPFWKGMGTKTTTDSIS